MTTRLQKKAPLKLIFILPLLLSGIPCISSAFAEIPFDLVTIDPNPPNSPWYKMVGDLNDDGLTDIVIGGAKGPMVGYLNPDWEKIHIADGGWDGVSGEIGDVDGDGDVDIAMGGVLWFENRGDFERVWPAHRIDKEKIHDVRLADVDNDGRMDLVGRNQSAFSGSGNKIFIYRQQENDTWTKEILDCPHGEGLRVGDLDQDGDADIIIGGLWYENTGKGNVPWVKHGFTETWTEPDAKVEIADLNSDGKLDIILTPAELKEEMYRVCWYEAPPKFTQPNWTEHVIIDSIESVVHALGVGDFDRDGDIDLSIAEMHQGRDPDEVSILINENRGRSWIKQVLSNRGSHDIAVVDIDNDGDVDLIGANHKSPSPLELWRNNLYGADRIPRGPQPGDLYREYAIHNGGDFDWRVTNPDAHDDRAKKYLPNPVLTIEDLDLKDAVRAEALLDRWGGHAGTYEKSIRFNGKDWLKIPELTTTPPAMRPEWYYSQDNPIVEIPLEQLKQGLNSLEGSCSSHTDGGWGQWGLNSVLLRVYYDKTKLRAAPSVAISYPVDGQTLTENPQIRVKAESLNGIGRVDILAWYNGYDENGDGIFRDWHQSYFQPSRGEPAQIRNHAGTAWGLPYQITWDTTLVPDQKPGSIKLIARVLDGRSGLWSVSKIVQNLSLERKGVSVRLFKAPGVTKRFGVRNGGRLSCHIQVPPQLKLANVEEAYLALRTWHGWDGHHNPMQFNGRALKIEGIKHHYKFNLHPLAPDLLRTGANTLDFASDTKHHMLEVLWPGPALLIRHTVPGS